MPPSKPAGLPRGIVASSVTPFDTDGKPDLARIRPHIDWLIGEGVAGLSPLGSAGEFFAMETSDRKRVLDAVLAANNRRVPVMAGTHHYSTRITIELSKHAEQAGADSLLIVPPYYARPTIRDAMDHYRRVAEAVSIPIVLYHNAMGTSMDFGTEELIALHREGAIAGVKMSNLLPDRMVQLLQAEEDRMTVYAGIDYVAFEGLCHGADGWISAIPSIVPRAANNLYAAIANEGNLVEARRQWRALAPLMRYAFRDSHIAHGTGAHWSSIMKGALNMIGPDIGDPVPPAQSLNAADKAALAGLLRGLGYDPRV